MKNAMMMLVVLLAGSQSMAQTPSLQTTDQVQNCKRQYLRAYSQVNSDVIANLKARYPSDRLQVNQIYHTIRFGQPLQALSNAVAVYCESLSQAN